MTIYCNNKNFQSQPCADGKKSRRAKQAEETKARIYESAGRLFTTNGVEQTTVAEIAKGAKVSVGSFYHHFKNKEEIVYRWLSEFDASHVDYYHEIMGRDETRELDVIDRLRVLMGVAEKAFASPGYAITRMAYALMMSDTNAGGIIAEPNREFYKIIRETIEEAISAGAIKAGHSVDSIIKQLIVINRGCMVEWLINEGKEDLEKMNDDLLRVYLDSIRA